MKICRGLSNYRIFASFKGPGGMYSKMAEKLSMPFFKLFPGLKITAGQRTMSGLIVGLTGQTLVWPVIFGCLSLNAFCSITL